jgi:hypothetical protein
MCDLAHKHGPLMMLWLGEVPTLVVSSPEAVQAITKTHDVAFADRHINSTVDILTFNGMDLVFGTYGAQWRQLRKLCVLELLSASRVYRVVVPAYPRGGGGAVPAEPRRVRRHRRHRRPVPDDL